MVTSGRHRFRREHDFRPLKWTFSIAILCTFFDFRRVDAIICIKDYQSPFRGAPRGYAMTLDCGRYMEHCVKIVTRDGQIIKDCDRVTLCPKDGSKVVHDAFYFCCRGNLCNSAATAGRRVSVHVMLAAVAIAFLMRPAANIMSDWWPSLKSVGKANAADD